MSTEPAPLLTAELANNAYEDASYVRGAQTQIALRAIATGRVACYDTATHVTVQKMTEEQALVLYTGNTSICVQTSAFGIYLAALRDAGVIKP